MILVITGLFNSLSVVVLFNFNKPAHIERSWCENVQRSCLRKARRWHCSLEQDDSDSSIKRATIACRLVVWAERKLSILEGICEQPDWRVQQCSDYQITDEMKSACLASLILEACECRPSREHCTVWQNG